MESIDKLYRMYKFTKNPNKILKWLCEHFDNIDLLNHVHRDTCEIAIKYLFNNKLGYWTEDEAKFIITFLVKQYLGKHWLKEEVNTVFLTQEEFDKEKNGKGVAIYIKLVGANPCICVSPEMLLYLQSNKSFRIFEALKVLFHECTHAIQDACFSQELIGYFETEEVYDCKKYIMILEIIASKIDKDFYNANYSHLLIENDANKKGVMEAAKIIKMYNSFAYDRYFKGVVEQEKKFYEKIMEEDYKVIVNNKEYAISPASLDKICSRFLKQNPGWIQLYPILEFAYHKDGTKKDIIELYSDKKECLKECLDKDIVEQLYEFLANNKEFNKDGGLILKKEIEELSNYIYKNKDNDEFLKKLLLHRLYKLKASKEAIEEYLVFLGFQDGAIGELSNKR